MKKILLKGSLLAIATIPAIVFVSCSSTSLEDQNTSPALEEEVKKFTKPIKTPFREYQATTYVRLINTASTPEEKYAFFKQYIGARLPILKHGFKMEVVSAKVNQEVITTAEVSLIISENGTPNSKKLICTVTDFIIEDTIENEVAKFAEIFLTKMPLLTPQEAINKIMTGEGESGRFAALKEVVDFEVKPAFTVTVRRDDFLIVPDKPGTIEVPIDIRKAGDFNGGYVWQMFIKGFKEI